MIRLLLFFSIFFNLSYADTATDLGLTFNDYNFLMGLSGLLTGFIFLFSSILLVIKKRF